MNIVGRLLMGSFFVPIVETALFQAVPISFLRRETELKYPTILFVSAAFFAASHFYSWAYVSLTFQIGLVLAFGYASRRRKDGRPFLLISIAHGLHNAVASFAQS